MLKLPLGTVVYTSAGYEYTVKKNGMKYITVSNHQGHEYKCVWKENKLVAQDSYSTTTFYTKLELEKHKKLEEVQKVIYVINQEFYSFYKVESETLRLKVLLEVALQSINEIENLETKEE